MTNEKIKQQKYSSKLNNLLDTTEIVIVSHQGSAGGNFVHNTYPAMQNAINQGAKIVEFDVSQNKDGEFYIFHETKEPIRINCQTNIRELTDEEISNMPLVNMNQEIVQHIPKLSEFLSDMKNHPEILLHVDHGWKWGKPLLDELDKYSDQMENIIFKCPLSETGFLDILGQHENKIMILSPIKTVDDLNVLNKYRDDVNFVGLEYIFDDANNPLVSKELINKLKGEGIHAFANALMLGKECPKLCGNFGDDVALLQNPEIGYGSMIEMGFDMIQTDWPFLLKQFLDSKNIKN